MNEKTLEAVTDELRAVLPGKKFGRIIPLSRRSFAIDFRLPGSRYLFVAAEPGNPRIYFIRRRQKDLERMSTNPQAFHMLVRKRLASSTVLSVEKLIGERVVSIYLSGTDEVGESVRSTLLIQLTGKSSNVFILNDREYILSSLIEKDIEGQRTGEKFSPPTRPQTERRNGPDLVELEPINGSISEALDEIHLRREAHERFNSQAENARRAVERELSKRQKLIAKLHDDLNNHGDAEKWKRFGDLILANLSTARRIGGKVIVKDYFQDDAPEIEVEAAENISLTDTAQKYFRRYTKAQNAGAEIEKRLNTVDVEIKALKQKQTELERAIADRDESYFAPSEQKSAAKVKKERSKFSGARQFTSSDGFEILVGKRAVDNDQLTFRVAGPVDLWLHAADYSGSHVIVRNPNRKDIPPRTLLEAAQLAAFYSSGRSQPKAAVHYTQKKFVNKPKGAAPGLVRLASFKTIMVTPSVPPAIDQKAL